MITVTEKIVPRLFDNDFGHDCVKFSSSNTYCRDRVIGLTLPRRALIFAPPERLLFFFSGPFPATSIASLVPVQVPSYDLQHPTMPPTAAATIRECLCKS